MARIPVTERRQALVDAAIRVVARDGVAATTTRAVVAEAGMSLASLHYAFASREELLDAVIADVTEQERRAAEDGLLPFEDSTGPAPAMVDVIRAGLDRFLDLLIEDPLRERALLELILHALRTPGHEAVLAAQYDTYQRAAQSSLRTAARASRSRWRVPIPTAARLLVTLTDGITMAWLADRDTAAARVTVVFAAQALAALAEPLDLTTTLTGDDPGPDSQEPGPC
jgi:TetR/AcrR family transcriptional regulator, regulator of biofilm formation and stress response